MQFSEQSSRDMTLDEVAEYLHLNKSTIEGLAQTCRIPAREIDDQLRFRKDEIDSWLSDNEIPDLGISGQNVPLTASGIEDNNLKTSSGVQITVVEPNSPAFQSGLRINDIIISLDGQYVEVITDLVRLMTKDVIGRPMNIDILRETTLTHLTITPAEPG